MASLTIPSPAAVNQELGRRNVLDFTRQTFHTFIENWHHQVLAKFLTKFALGYISRGMIFMPPRHGKTEFSSRRTPAFIFGKNPDAKIIATSYTADLAGTISRDVQRIIREAEYQALFPNTQIGGKHDTEAAYFFTITGREGYYRAAGIGGGIGGYGASYGLIDDPIKDAKEAESQVYRDAIWNWYQSTFYTRLEQPGSILLTTTRWHEDDLAGRLLKQQTQTGADQWTVLNLPAIAQKVRHALDPRNEGEALWPDRYPLERLLQIKATLGTSWWEALYQGEPVPPGGDLFKREWFPIIPATALPTSNMVRCRYWDAAGTPDDGDWTAGAKLAYHPPTKRIFIEHMVRGQWSTGVVDQIIGQTAITDGFNCRIREEREPGSAGLAVINARRLKLIGYDYRGLPATGEKTLRWKPMAAQAEGHNVILVEGAWNQAFLDEVELAPKGKNDDQLDAASGAFNELVIGSGPIQIVKLAGF